MEENHMNQLKTAMEWSERSDTLLCREMLAVNPFTAKRKTVQRTKKWEMVVEHLEKIDSPTFKVTVRSVRDRYTLISRKYRKRMSFELKASGISPESSELDTLLEELTDLEDLAEQEKQDTEDKSKKVEEDQAKAKDVRKMAMEKLAETKKRKAEDGDEVKKRKSRKSSSETIVYLREKSENELEMRRQEIDFKSKQLEDERKRQDETSKRSETMMRMMIEQNQAMLQVMSRLLQK